MKLKLIGVALIGMTSASFGTIINPGNLTTTNLAVDLPVMDNAGNIVPSGTMIVSVGNFGGGAPNAELTGFNQFSTNFGTNNFDPGAGASDFFSLSFQVPSDAAGDFIDNNIFVVMQTAAGDIAIWEGPTVNPDAAGLEGSTAVAVGVGSGSLVVGSIVSNPPTVTIPGLGDANFENGIQMFAIPEPSVSLLAGLAGLGFLVRRKR